VSTVDPLTKEAIKGLGPGAYLVSILPSAVFVLTLLALVSSRLYPWAEPLHKDRPERIAPGFDSILQQAKNLGAAGAVVLTLFVLVIAVLTRPIQFAAIQLLEGYGGGRGRGLLAAFAVELHARRHGIHVLRKKAMVRLGPDTLAFADVAEYSRNVRRVTRMNQRAERVVADYPRHQELFMPTLLGNILRRMESTAGERYGLSTIESYPRLYPYLSTRLESEVAVQQDALSTGATFVFVLGALALASTPLVVRLDGWSLVPIVFALVAVVSYRSTRSAARRYAELVATAYDLHRFDMLRAMHRRLPDDIAQEITENRELSAFLRRSVSMPELERSTSITLPQYDHSPPAAAD
jgi:hypothetical protein